MASHQLSSLPVDPKFRVFWRYRDELIGIARNKEKDEFQSYFCSSRKGNKKPNVIMEILGLSAEDVKPFCERRKTPSFEALYSYFQIYLQYALYKDEINSAFFLYAKVNDLGQWELGRAKKEVLKICKRNDLYHLVDIDDYGVAFRINQEAEDVVLGTLVMGGYENCFSEEANVGDDFESLCLAKLTECGFSATKTKRTGDFGCDIIAEKKGVSYAIQCKYSSGRVGIKAVQEVLASQRYYQADVAVVVTNADYTAAAIELAACNKVILINSDKIHKIDVIL